MSSPALLFALGTAALGTLLAAGPAGAVLDIEDRGPVLDAGNFQMRVTNAGIVGNAFYGLSRSSDPSFEYPAFSGQELLNHAALWVGAIDESGQPRVSGGPILEWRPTLAPDDVVRLRRRSDLGCRRFFDDDGDGVIDEERLNGRDDDGDGVKDEDLGLFADQDAGAEFVDDRPEAVNFVSPTGESHQPLGLTAYQVVSAWSHRNYQGVAALTYQITNHGAQTLRNVYLGVLADFDSRLREDRAGHRNDRIVDRSYSVTRYDGQAKITVNGVTVCPSPPPCPPIYCYSTFAGTLPVLADAGSSLPAIAILPLEHTLDPISGIDPALGFAPYRKSFRTSVFSGEGIPGQGGVPALDEDRYSALAGTFAEESRERGTDWVTLVSCGPFRELGPGQSVSFSVAFVAGANADSVADRLPNIALLHDGMMMDLLPNETARPDTAEYTVGKTGVAGHEACIEPPPGHTFFLDPNCKSKFSDSDGPLPPEPITYYPGTCIWTDLDCDHCTGNLGKETPRRWLDPGHIPPSPSWRVTAGDHEVTIEWDNMPEVLIRGEQVGGPSSRFLAYRLFKLARWRGREGLLPPLENWSLLGTFSHELSSDSEVPLDSVTVVLDYDRVLYEQKLYPVGRYRYVDRDVLNGFDYLYAVTTLYIGGVPWRGDPEQGFQQTRLESPILTRFDDRVTPRTEAVESGDRVIVVPNPYKSAAGWDRAPTFGDAFPRHIDFMHLPKAVVTIRIYTLAGDFVAQIVHDARDGHGQAKWDLISRNGQETESGVYLFTVDSELGHQVGKFVVVR